MSQRSNAMGTHKMSQKQKSYILIHVIYVIYVNYTNHYSGTTVRKSRGLSGDFPHICAYLGNILTTSIQYGNLNSFFSCKTIKIKVIHWLNFEMLLIKQSSIWLTETFLNKNCTRKRVTKTKTFVFVHPMRKVFKEGNIQDLIFGSYSPSPSALRPPPPLGKQQFSLAPFSTIAP